MGQQQFCPRIPDDKFIAIISEVTEIEAAVRSPTKPAVVDCMPTGLVEAGGQAYHHVFPNLK